VAGNIVKLKNGRYRLRYKDFSVYVAAKSDREAERLLAKFIAEVDSGDWTQPSRITFKQFAEKWLKDYAEVELAPKTVFRYKQLLESRIYPAIGDKKLCKIKPLDLIEFYNALRKKHTYISIKNLGSKNELRESKEALALSEKTIKHHHVLIGIVFEKAIKWGVHKGVNPAKRVDAPKPERKKALCYNESQTQRLLDALGKLDSNATRYKVATMIALMTGARVGEIMGLEWQDIDFENKTIEIQRASQYLPGKGTFAKGPKTEQSKRKISINDMLLQLLSEYRDDQQEKGFICQDNNRLFISHDAQPMFPHTVSKWLTTFLRRNNLPPLNFHGLRHTSATFLISRGMDIQTVAGRLGHSSSATTQNIYSHFLDSKDRLAADLIEDAFAKKGQSGAGKEKNNPSEGE
jgi:integrase